MKRFLLCITILWAMCWMPAAAQQPFSIDAEDLQFEAEIGSLVSVSTWTIDPSTVPFMGGDWFDLQALADQTGDNQVWDFTSFTYDPAPSTLNYWIQEFDASDPINPGADVAAYQGANCVFWIPQTLNAGIPGDIYDHFFFSTDAPFNYLEQHGNILDTGSPRTENVPPDRLYQFPLTLGDSRTSSYQQTVFGVGTPAVADVTVTREIDGRGTLVIAGATADALRIKETKEISFVGGGTLTELTADFITIEGVGAKLQHNNLPPPLDGWELASYSVDAYGQGDGEYCGRPTQHGVLFVVDDAANLNNSDALAQALMESLNLEVEVVSDESVTTGDANGRDLIVVSGTADATQIGADWSATGVPLVSWDGEFYDELLMTGAAQGTDYGVTGGTNTLTLVDAGHPIANGFAGEVAVYNGAFAMNWGLPTSAASIVANDAGGLATIFTYDTGDMLVGGSNAPARRVGFFMNPVGPENATTDGMILLENALLWALGREAEIARSVAVEAVEAEIPDAVHLDQNYPNPFNPATVIRFSLATAGPVSLSVYNVLGQQVATLVDETLPAGTYTTDFRADGLPSGVYLYKLQAGGTVQARKMLLAK